MAATFTNVYQATIKGNLIQIGNTLGLSKASNALTPGTLGSIGVFISTDTTNQAAGWQPGTTTDYTKNSSSAILNLPAGATVTHAELIWSASYVVPGGNVTANIGDPITFTDSQGTNHSLTATSVNITGIALSENAENSTNYVKSANVTSIVSAAGSGTYTCGSVPCTMSATSNNLQYAGWSLYVAYSLSTDNVRNIVIFVGQTVSIDAPYAVPANYPGTPYPIRVFYTVGEGDAIITGDQFNTRPVPGVTAQYNIGTSVQPTTNPFASIIGDQNGGIDTTGTFGTLNPNGVAGTNITGGRQGWDIANNVSILPAMLGPSFTTLNMDIGTNNDPAVMAANGYVVDLSQPAADLTKSVNKTTARGKDILTYTLVYHFGTVPSTVSGITVIDTIPNGVSFLTSTVTINNVGYPSYNPNPPGITLPDITVPTTFTISFSAVVATTVNAETIPNSAFASYNFSSGTIPFTNTNASNTVNTVIDPFSALATKSTNLSYADIGSQIDYTVTIPNDGATLTNVTFIDTIPNGTTFVPNSFTINSVSQPGVTPNPPGAPLTDINPNTVTTVTFSVIVTTIPNPNPIPNSATINTNYVGTIPNASQGINTNIVSTKVNNATLAGVKSVSKVFANIGDTLTYTITFNNLGSVTANNVIFIDTIPNDTTLVTGSFKQDGVAISGSSNPPGVTLPNAIAPLGVSTITFQVRVNTIPNPNPIPNSASTTYNYTIDPSVPNGGSSGTSTNIVNTQVNNANLGNIQKSVNKTYATCGDILIYTITVPNNGNTTAINVVIKDTIPSGTSFISGSVTIDGNATSYTPLSMNVGTIPAGGQSVVTFRVQVVC